MRIARKDISRSRAAEIQKHLGMLATMAGEAWPVCGPRCPSAIARDCHRGCPDICLALSDAPKEYPLEAIIAPLVYELQRLDGIRPCWSCEGHERFGDLWKVPQVWFYADRQIHLRVLADAVTALNLQGALRVDWEVAVTYSDPDNPETTYTLRPKQNQAVLVLSELQADVASLAEAVVELCREQALNLGKIGA